MSGLEVQATALAAPPLADVKAIGARRAPIAAPLRDAFLAADAGAEQLDRLFGAKALCVTTGQQPGLLTGPLYTLYKALSAVALARRCEAVLRRPVVPVFWVAGDDHDFAEANHTHLLTADNEVTRLRLRERPADAPLTPLYREPVGAEIAAVLDAVERQTPATEFRDQVMEWLRRHYAPSADLASAFAGALADLLGPFGLVVFRPTHPAAKAAMAPLLLRTLAHAADVSSRLARRAADLREAGQPVPVHVDDGATLVMLEAGLGRDRLVPDGDAFVTRRSAERFSTGELADLGRDDPTRLSPNVLLRPVLEAALLPTLAYVAGPGELAYLPQCDPLYELFDVVPQARVPRWSGRIIESRVRKVLDKYEIAPEALDAPEGQLEQSLVRDEMPQDALDAIRTLRATIQEEYDRLRGSAAGVDPTLGKSVDSARNQALAGVQDVEKRIVSHLKQQNEIVMQQLAKARRNLYPLGRPQERILTVAPFLMRYDRGLLDAVLAAASALMDALEPAPAGS